MDRDSRDYFEQRERAERAAAEQALSPEARRAHQELAQSYAALAAGLADQPPAANDAGGPGKRSRLTIIAAGPRSGG